jgi:iron complex transport system substrate-binding protein
MKRSRIYLIVFFVLVSCHSNNKEAIPERNWEKITRYSNLFDLFQDEQAYKLIIYEASNEKVIKQSYYFSPDSSDFELPCNNIISLSSVFTGFLAALNQQEKITAVDNMDYISDSLMRKIFDLGKVTETGADEGILLEKIISLKPDLIVHSGFSNSLNKHTSIYIQAGISVVKCHNYLEESPLGRAEWIKFFGLLTGTLPQADSLFNEIEKSYLEIVSKMKNVQVKPTVLTGALFGNAWDVPSGQSYAARLIQDAGGEYLWKEQPGTGRLALSFETVLNIASDADFWIHVNAFNSLNEMLSSESRYRHFKAFAERNVYNNNKQINPFGGNAFWETAPVRPDIVLKDLAKIFHPKLFENTEPIYYKQLQ